MQLTKHALFVVCAAIMLSVSSCALFTAPESYDLVITGGEILDGSGASAFVGDIAIKEGRIVAMGKLSRSAPVVIDATGCYVAPGFIDIHTHCDGALGNQSRSNAKNYLMQGVATVVTGNCGNGTYRVAEYYDTLREQGIGPNTMHLVGHGTVRSAVMGQEARAPTPEELAQMKALVQQAMDEGALGLSTGLFYTPGSFAQTEEVIELARVAGAAGGIYASHLRDESNYNIGLLNAIREAIEIGEQAQIPVQISHLKALGKPVWGQAAAACQLIEDARARGVKVYADQYPYPASSTSLNAATMPLWAKEGGGLNARLRDEELAPRIRREVAENIDRRGGPDSLIVTSVRNRPELSGKSLAEISKSLGKSPEDAAIELVLAGGSSVISFNMSDSDVAYFMKKPYVMTGSDGSIPTFGRGVTHPRNYGTFPRKIKHYAIEQGVISLPQAIRSCTSLPAEMLNLSDRGLLKKGFVADIVVFNPDTLRDLATFAEPHQYSEGIEYLLINGVPVVEHGEYNGQLAGRPLLNR